MSKIIGSLNTTGLAGDDFTKYSLVPTTNVTSNPFVWILSSSDPQPVGIVGVWRDNETWDDTAVWYD